ncbi:MAG: prepilin peptidase [Chloroflexota bacterium]|nr:MAG: prepilin peptidase [Chloroflexota bacterium]
MDTLTVVIAGAIGLGVGLVADRIAARWPPHEDGSVRRLDWRTAAVAIAGAAALALLVDRLGNDPKALIFVSVVVVLLILLFATDLDQRLLPDVVTLPLVGYALVGFVTGIGPFVRTPADLLWAAVAGFALPAGLLIVSIPFGAGAIGMGDLKLLLGVGLIVGATRIVATVLLGALAAAVAIVILIAARRITLKSYVPYGPFLIAGALWAMLGTPPV